MKKPREIRQKLLTPKYAVNVSNQDSSDEEAIQDISQAVDVEQHQFELAGLSVFQPEPIQQQYAFSAIGFFELIQFSFAAVIEPEWQSVISVQFIFQFPVVQLAKQQLGTTG